MLDYAQYLKSRHKSSLPKGWAGVSLQHVSIDFMKPPQGQDYSAALPDYLQILERLLESRFAGEDWMLQHEKPQYPWLPPHLPRSEKFEPLYAFFQATHIDLMYHGEINLQYSELQAILPSLLQYPSLMYYQDIVLRHTRWNVIIKIVHHFTVDLISDDEKMLSVALKDLHLERINVVHYRRQNG